MTVTDTRAVEECNAHRSHSYKIGTEFQTEGRDRTYRTQASRPHSHCWQRLIGHRMQQQ